MVEEVEFALERRDGGDQDGAGFDGLITHDAECNRVGGEDGGLGGILVIAHLELDNRSVGVWRSSVRKGGYG